MINRIEAYNVFAPRAIRWLFYLLFGITPFLMSSHTSELFEFNKMMAIYVISLFSGTFWLLGLLFGAFRFKPFPRILLFYTVFLLMLCGSWWFSIDPHTSWYGYYGRWNGGILSIIAYMSLFTVAVQVLKREDISRLVQISLIASLIVIMWGVTAKYGIDPACKLFADRWDNLCWTDQFRPAERMFSTIGQPNWLGTYLVVHFFLALYYFVSSILHYHKSENNVQVRIQWHAVPLGAYLILCFIAIVFTRSRSSLLALAIGIALGVGIALIRKARLFAAYSLVSILVVVCMLMFSSGIFNSFLYDDAGVNQHITSSADIRKIVWRGAWDVGKAYPLFGSGVETFGYSYYFYRPREHNDTSEWDFLYNKAHNEFLHYIATTGFVGFSSYIFLIGSVIFTCMVSLYQTYKKRMLLFLQPESYLFLAYIALNCAHFFGFSTSLSQVFFYLLPAFLLSHRSTESTNQEPSVYSKHKNISLLLGSVIILGFIWSVWLLNAYYRADVLYARAKNNMAASDYVSAMRDLTDALKLRYEHVYEDKLSQTLAYLSYQVSLKNPTGADGLITLSEAANEKALRAAPLNIIYWKTKARNHLLFYQAKKEFRYLEIGKDAMMAAVVIAPTDAQTRYALAVIYKNMAEESKDKKAKAMYINLQKQTLQETLALRPGYLEAQQMLNALNQ